MDCVRRDASTHRYCRSPILPASLLVRSRVEGDEEHEVGAQSCAASEGGEFLTSARSHMWQGGKELVGIVIVRGIVHKTYLKHQSQPEQPRGQLAK